MMGVPSHEHDRLRAQPPGRILNCLMLATHRRAERDLNLFSQESPDIPDNFPVLAFQLLADRPPTMPNIEHHFRSRTKGCVHNTNDALPTVAASRISQLQRDVRIWQQLPVIFKGGQSTLQTFEIRKEDAAVLDLLDRKSTRLNSSHLGISYAV